MRTTVMIVTFLLSKSIENFPYRKREKISTKKVATSTVIVENIVVSFVENKK